MKICPKCAAENADTAKYCNECGALLEIMNAEVSETVNNTEPEPETPKEDVSPIENAELTPVTVAETVNDCQESTTEQTEKKEGKSPKKKNRLIIGIVIAVFTCLLVYIATRPKIESINVIYRGNQQEGVVLNDDNSGISVVANYSNGDTRVIPIGKWHVQSPKTLTADSSETIVVTYKGLTNNLTVNCTTTKIVSAKASYNGSQYEGTVINQDSDFTVTVTYGDGHTETYDNTRCRLEPSEVKLKAGKESKIKLTVSLNNGSKGIADFSIIGKEKPFTNPDIEGDHYNCSSKQFVKYLNAHTQFTIEPTATKYFGDEYTTYIITPPATSSFTYTGLGLRENEDGKVCIIALLSTQVTDGIAESLWLAEYFDDTVEERTNDASLALFLKGSVFATDKTIIIKNENISDKGQVFFIMPREYSDNNALDEFLKK